MNSGQIKTFFQTEKHDSHIKLRQTAQLESLQQKVSTFCKNSTCTRTLYLENLAKSVTIKSIRSADLSRAEMLWLLRGSVNSQAQDSLLRQTKTTDNIAVYFQPVTAVCENFVWILVTILKKKKAEGPVSLCKKRNYWPSDFFVGLKNPVSVGL